MRTVIEKIEYYLPEKVLSNKDLADENPSWDMENLVTATGITQRHIAKNDETALDLAYQACIKILNDEDRKEIDGLIFCTQSPDYILPSNASVLHKLLNLNNEVMAFDINLACSGYVYGLAMANSFIKSGMCHKVLLVTSDTYSKYIHPKDKAARVLFGDGAAATILSGNETMKGIIDVVCATDGAHHDSFIIPAGACRMAKSDETGIEYEDEHGNIRSSENIYMDGMGILKFVCTQVPRQVKGILKKNSLTVDDIDVFVLHQASKKVLDSLERLLRIKPEKVFRNIDKIGNTVSSSIPIALKDAMDENKLKKGNKVLMSGYGVGLSWASAILQY